MIATSFKLKNEQKASGIDRQAEGSKTSRQRECGRQAMERMEQKDIMKRSIRSDTLFARKK